MGAAEVNEFNTYVGIKGMENSVVQKSKPLQEISRENFSLCELKILDIYLARINSRNPDVDTVVLKKGEIEKILGVDRIRKEELKKRLANLFTPITVNDWYLDEDNEGATLITLFQEMKMKKIQGNWEITLVCTPKAKAYIFNIENIGYLMYKLKNVINLTSRYSYVLFLYLADHPKRSQGSFTVGLDELRTMLKCPSEKYNEFKYFNRSVLKKACDEINRKTDMKFSYKPIRNGKSVASIQFDIESNMIDFSKFKCNQDTDLLLNSELEL